MENLRTRLLNPDALLDHSSEEFKIISSLKVKHTRLRDVDPNSLQAEETTELVTRFLGSIPNHCALCKRGKYILPSSLCPCDPDSGHMGSARWNL